MSLDSSEDWTESTLFSPSKARAQQAQAKDWSSVDAWLAKRYGSKRLPPFERNEDTLQALLTLATVNENADEQRSQIERVEKAALLAHSKRAANVDPIYENLSSQLSGHADFDTLSKATVLINAADVGTPSLAAAAIDLTSRKSTTEQQLHNVESRVDALKAEQGRAMETLTALRQDEFQPPSNLPEQTAGWVRSTKHLKAKIGEYDDRLNHLRTSQPTEGRIDSIVRLSDDLNAQQARLEELKAELSAYQQLPPNPKDAQSQLESARKQLLALTRQRDRLFESLAEG